MSPRQFRSKSISIAVKKNSNYKLKKWGQFLKNNNSTKQHAKETNINSAAWERH